MKAVARYEFLYGCVHVELEATKLQENGETLAKVFDEQRLLLPHACP